MVHRTRTATETKKRTETLLLRSMWSQKWTEKRQAY